MKGSHQKCPHCQAEDIRVNRANETIQCESCDRILEERMNDFRTTTILLERESTFPVVTQDGLRKFKFDDGLLQNDDPFQSTGFITGFSQTSLQPMGAFTLTSRTFPGDLAELERLLIELDVDQSSGNKVKGAGGKKCTNSKGSEHDWLQRQVLEAYFHIQEVCDILGFHRDDCDEAVRIFKQHAATVGVSKDTEVPQLAVGALVLALRAHSKQIDMTDIMSAAGVSVNDTQAAIQAIELGQISEKNISNQATSEEAISTFLPLFCGQLAMSPATQELARQISQATGKHGVCGRRNPQSVAAAVIYLAFNLEDQKRTQTEICKVTGLTEVTLRKTYKELLACHQQILPADYTPKVPLKRLLPSVSTSTGFTAPPPPTPNTQPRQQTNSAPAFALMQATMQAMMQPVQQQGMGGVPPSGVQMDGESARQAFAPFAAMPFPFPMPPAGQGGMMSEAQAAMLQQFKDMLMQQYKALQEHQQQQQQHLAAGSAGNLV